MMLPNTEAATKLAEVPLIAQSMMRAAKAHGYYRGLAVQMRDNLAECPERERPYRLRSIRRFGALARDEWQRLMNLATCAKAV